MRSHEMKRLRSPQRIQLWDAQASLELEGLPRKLTPPSEVPPNGDLVNLSPSGFFPVEWANISFPQT